MLDICGNCPGCHISWWAGKMPTEFKKKTKKLHYSNVISMSHEQLGLQGYQCFSCKRVYTPEGEFQGKSSLPWEVIDSLNKEKALVQSSST